MECLLALRLACIKEDEAGAFNKFLGRIKGLFEKGSHRPFWV